MELNQGLATVCIEQIFVVGSLSLILTAYLSSGCQAQNLLPNRPRRSHHAGVEARPLVRNRVGDALSAQARAIYRQRWRCGPAPRGELRRERSLGVAGVLYGTRLLLQAAQNPKFQEAMRRGGGGDGSPDGDPEREPDPSRGRTDSGEPAPRRTAEQPSYFTTEVRDTSETLRASAHHFPSLPSRVLRRFVAATAVHRACPGDGLLSRRGLQGLVGRLRGRL